MKLFQRVSELMLVAREPNISHEVIGSQLGEIQAVLMTNKGEHNAKESVAIAFLKTLLLNFLSIRGGTP